MPTVEAEVRIDAPLDTVYFIAKDIESYPEFMDDVQSVQILEQNQDAQTSHWETLLKEFNRTINWTEEDCWDDAAKTCEWEQIDGDFDAYAGTWEFVADDEGKTIARLEIEYEYSPPLIGALIQKIVRKKMQDNVDSMLAAIRERAEADAAG